jgi:serine phosphatase RsbU (regulator of sigma subunit)
LFGDARLRDLLDLCAGRSAEEVCRNILASVREFVGAAPQSDDLTVTVIRYGPA